jgi:hypothetical protein
MLQIESAPQSIVLLNCLMGAEYGSPEYPTVCNRINCPSLRTEPERIGSYPYYAIHAEILYRSAINTSLTIYGELAFPVELRQSYENIAAEALDQSTSLVLAENQDLIPNQNCPNGYSRNNV